MKLQRSEIKPGIILMKFDDAIRMGDDCRRLEQEVDQMISREETWVIFDFSDLNYLDSSGIGSIVKCLTRLKKAGGALRLAGVKGMVEGVLKLTRVNTVVEIFPTPEAAAVGFSPGT